ncbi:MAG: hypothetical protein ACRDBM_13930 [Sporomusa sp.]
MLDRAWKLVSDIPIAATAVTIGALGTKYCGDSFWAVLILSYAAIFFDTATKWITITKRFYVDTTGCKITEVRGMQVLRGILGEAWEPDYLSSRNLYRIIEKIGTYTAVIAICHAAGKWIPVLDFMGLHFTPATVFPASASIAVFLVELSSINENLKEMGQTGIADKLASIVSMVVNKITPKS